MATHQDLRWSPLALVPERAGIDVPFPLEEIRAYPELSGRSGDLLIIQLRSGIGVTRKRQATLRSLGLAGIRTSSLRSSREPGIFGYIRAVRDLVGVVELGGIMYRSAQLSARSTHLQYERIEYGSNTRPGGLVRNSDGEYFVFESDRNGLLLNWSTSLSASEAFEQFQQSFIDEGTPLRVRSGESASMVMVSGRHDPGHSPITHDRTLDSGDGDWEEYQVDPSNLIGEMPTEEAIDLIRRRDLPVVAARIAFRDVFMTWHRPYARFIDSDVESAEVGVYLNDLSRINGARRFVRNAGRARFFSEADITILVRERGNPKHIWI
ncbi:uL30 family ribosomal protein [Galbitalea soli]|uniref:Mitochondrial large ribosomal subunit protein uL30m n=1 Tax=Galbitalea soli TaxID=1268042 RepID=A0A7C9TQW2_9MICO|nr:uL30 family ribosomal protein [Galbitalea soli]NEM90904.1 mitochondrial large ribosomal subunit protein uL30m [Galbitalea soli]NYJ31628.1 ribosomal protein L30/L7E [Galbitalea soli]